MTRKRKPSGILGPDGKPYVPPPPEPKPRPASTADEEIRAYHGDGADRTYSYRVEYGHSLFGSIFRSLQTTDNPEMTPLGDVVAEQVRALVADFDGQGGEELPRPPADLTAYTDAFKAAQKACQHPNYEDVVYAKREAYCPDCRQYFKRPRGIFG